MNLLRAVIAVAVRNPVFANLLMVCILAAGYFSLSGMQREVYPEFSLDIVTVEVVYPGAGSADVERAICAPIEEAIADIDGIDELTSRAGENYGIVWFTLWLTDREPSEVVQEVKDRVDQITVFPEEAEKPVVREAIVRHDVISIAIYGNVPERTLKRYAQETRDDLLADPAISQVTLSGVRQDEILIEVSEVALAAYALSLEQIMAVIARSSLDMPAGLIRTSGEEVTLRVTGQRYAAADYEDLVAVESGGTIVRLGDIARVREGFEESVARGRFNGAPAVLVRVYKSPEQDATRIAQVVHDYVAAQQSALPNRLGMSVWGDRSKDISGRLRMLVATGAMGIALVFLALWSALEFRVAFWVAAGIPVAFAGAIVIMNVYGQTLNMISLFALIMVSGVIVDDAIVIAESIHSRRRSGLSPQLAAVEGTQRVALPVLGSSLTTIAAFVPILYVTGVMGRFIHVLPVVVIGAIVASSVEAFGILPAHLAHARRRGPDGTPRGPNRVRRALDGWIDRLITHGYRRIYRPAMRGRLVTVSLAVAAVLVGAGLVLGGRTPLVLLPDEDVAVLTAQVRFPEGAPVTSAERAVDRIESAAYALNDDPELQEGDEDPLVRQVYSVVGEIGGFLPERGNNVCEVRIELTPPEERVIGDEQIIERWRERIGPLHDAVEFTIQRERITPPSRPVEIRLLGPNLADLSEVAERVQDRLRAFEGITNLYTDLVPGKRELRVKLSSAGRALGLTLDGVARQLRHGFFGGEAVELQRGRDLVKVRVRYPEDERRSIADLERLRIATPAGHQVPFLEVAEVEWARGFKYIMHQDGKRRVRVMADLDERRASSEQILEVMEAGFLDEVVRDYNGVTWKLGGNRAQMDQSLGSLIDGLMMAMIAIYAILASMLRSYVQPLVIIAAVPIGFVGAVFGHAILGYDLTMMSLFGIVALSGVVVNDSLVLVDAINRSMSEGKGVTAAVLSAGEERFRAVTLTTLTTVVGLCPILLEPSGQAQSVKPMAVALAAGLLFATLVTLFVVPALYLLLNDIRRFFYWLRFGGAYPLPEAVEEAWRRAHGAATGEGPELSTS